MKKFLSLIIAIIFIFSSIGLTACSQPAGSLTPPNNGGNPPIQDTNPPTNTNPPEETNPPSETKPPQVIPTIVTYETYGSYWMRNHDYKTMPVAAYNALPSKVGYYTYNYIDSESTYDAYVDAGVNVMQGLAEGWDSNYVSSALDFCEERGLSYLLAYAKGDKVTSKSAIKSAFINRDHPAFGGIMAFDEPGYKLFEGIKKGQDFFYEVLEEEWLSDALWHVNLLPTYANTSQLWWSAGIADRDPGNNYSYEEYVDDYLSIVNPKVLSYDYYPIRKDANDLSSGYFENMSIIKNKAMGKNIPFWVFIQTSSWNGTRAPSEAEVKWQVNSALSYGAKGIQYFCGVTPGRYGEEQFGASMFDRDGNKTIIYDYVKDTNNQVQVVDEVLMCSKNCGIIVLGDIPFCNSEKKYMKIPASDCIETYGELTTAYADHSMIGCFDYNQQDVYYVTNNSITKNDYVYLEFDSEVSGYTVYNGVKKEFSGQELEFELTAGNGLLIVLNY